MTLYDAILLLRARWHWFVALPALSVALTAAMLLVTTPRDYEAHGLVQIDASLPGSHVVARLGTRTFAERIGAGSLEGRPRKGEAQLVEVVARAGTSEAARRLVSKAIAALNADADREAAASAAALRRVVAERAALRHRHDRFAMIDYEVLTRRIAAWPPIRPSGRIALVEPILATTPHALRLWPLLASLVSAGVVVFEIGRA